MSSTELLTRETASQYMRVRPSLKASIRKDAAEALHGEPSDDGALAWLYGEYKRLKSRRQKEAVRD